jgi:hydrogenase maturation protease
MNEWEWQLLEEAAPAESVTVSGVQVRKGDLVCLRPRPGGDIFDLALAGQTAIVESIEQDYDGRLHLAVVLAEDPGKDLGVLRQPGHRFFFAAEEVEPLEQRARVQNPAEFLKILVAGVGNIFLGDDGFGVEVARRLVELEFPEGVQIRDFGIRGYDLAYALLDDYDLVILVDAAPRGSPPGTLYVIEPDVGEGEGAAQAGAALDAHAMNPVNVLRLAHSMGRVSARVLLVACEPASLGGDEGHMGLSGVVSEVVDQAVGLVGRLIREAHDTDKGRVC